MLFLDRNRKRLTLTAVKTKSSSLSRRPYRGRRIRCAMQDNGFPEDASYAQLVTGIEALLFLFLSLI